MGSYWWSVVAKWYFLVAPVWKYVEDGFTEEVISGVWLARPGTGQSLSSHRSRMGYRPWQSCRLLLQNLGARGEHVTSHPLWMAA